MNRVVGFADVPETEPLGITSMRVTWKNRGCWEVEVVRGGVECRDSGGRMKEAVRVGEEMEVLRHEQDKKPKGLRGQLLQLRDPASHCPKAKMI